MFIMVDGIDGSGKSTVIKTWKEQLAAAGRAIFDLKAYWLKTGRYPELSELKGYDFIFTAEPTFVGVGQVIREELIVNGAGYPPRAIAEAYALDRLILYKKIIIPLSAEKKCVIQDRGFTSSFAYQPLADKNLTLKFLSALPGNALALKNPPDQIVLLQVDPEAALKRLLGRKEKQDNVVFERAAFQKKLARVFASRQYRSFFTRRGSRVYGLPTGEKLAILKERARQLLPQLLA